MIIDAVGVLRTGNVALLKFGHDARATAECLLSEIIEPALAKNSLPASAIGLIDSENHAATWALLSDRRLGLAVLRGSGRVVRRLGDIARQSGVPPAFTGPAERGWSRIMTLIRRASRPSSRTHSIGRYATP